jgi:hypothetical protein
VQEAEAAPPSRRAGQHRDQERAVTTADHRSHRIDEPCTIAVVYMSGALELGSTPRSPTPTARLRGEHAMLQSHPAWPPATVTTQAARGRYGRRRP